MQQNQRVHRRAFAASLWLMIAAALSAAPACSGDDDAGGSGAEADAGPLTDAEPPGGFDAFDEVVSSLVEEEGLEGASAVVVDRESGEVHLQGYGAFDAERLYLIPRRARS